MTSGSLAKLWLENAKDEDQKVYFRGYATGRKVRDIGYDNLRPHGKVWHRMNIETADGTRYVEDKDRVLWCQGYRDSFERRTPPFKTPVYDHREGGVYEDIAR